MNVPVNLSGSWHGLLKRILRKLVETRQFYQQFAGITLDNYLN